MSEPSKTPPLFKAAETVLKDVIEGEPILTSVEHGLEELFFDHPSEFVPSTWNIQPHEEADCIYATNNVTGRIFEGAVSVFNKLLRG